MHTWTYISVWTPNPILSWSPLLSLPRNLLKIPCRGPGPQLRPQAVLQSNLADCCHASCFSSRCAQPTLSFCGPNHAKNQVVTFHCISWAQLVLTRTTWLFPVCVLSVLVLVPTCYGFYSSCFTLPLINVPPIWCIQNISKYVPKKVSHRGTPGAGNGWLWGCLGERLVNLFSVEPHEPIPNQKYFCTENF